MLFAVVIFLSVVVLGVIAALRFTKGIIPLRTYESRELPGFPGPAGLIHRLDGAEKRQRKLALKAAGGEGGESSPDDEAIAAVIDPGKAES